MEKLINIIKEARRIVFFGGAGVSTESGIPDFRSAGGVFKKRKYDFAPEYIVSHDFFFMNPESFYDFYYHEMVFPQAQPNAAHRALAELEKSGKLSAVITQNIDGLHQKAGSQNVLELHGSIHRNYCLKCHKFHTLEDMMKQKGVPHCDCSGKGIIKPDVVLYGEALDDDVMSKTLEEISNADVLIVGGTSLNVYPAAGFIRYFRGKHLILINKTATSMDHLADVIVREPIGEVFDEIMKHL